jgi:hypothetical protein
MVAACVKRIVAAAGAIITVTRAALLKNSRRFMSSLHLIFYAGVFGRAIRRGRISYGTTAVRSAARTARHQKRQHYDRKRVPVQPSKRSCDTG